MFKFVKGIYVWIVLLMFASCSNVKYEGIVDINDLERENSLTGEVKEKDVSDDIIFNQNPKLSIELQNFKKSLIKKERSSKEKHLKKEKDKKQIKIRKINKMSRLTNLEQLGVIDITSRLNFNSGDEKKTNMKKEISKDKYYVIRDNPFDDKFGGKLVCNEEVLILRLDRSKLVNCMEKERSKLDFNWKTFLIDYKIMNVMDYKRKDLYNKCRLIHAISVSAYHNLSSCLIEDRKKHGLFKYRNINSFGVDFKLIKEKGNN